MADIVTLFPNPDHHHIFQSACLTKYVEWSEWGIWYVVDRMNRKGSIIQEIHHRFSPNSREKSYVVPNREFRFSHEELRVKKCNFFQ